MAADCMTRVWALAIATLACIGLPGALVYATVRIAAARRYGAVFALGLVLVFWVTISAAYYPRVCVDLVPWLGFLRRGRGRGRGQGEPSLLVPQRSSYVTVDVFPRRAPFERMLPWEAQAVRAARDRARAGGADDGNVVPPPPPPPPPPYPLYEQQRVPLAQRHGDRGGGGMMGAFPWEAPAAERGGARARGADDHVPPPPPPYPLYPCEQQRVPLAQRHGDPGGGMVDAFQWDWEAPAPAPAARGGARARGADDDVRPPPPPPPPPPRRYPLYPCEQRRVPLAQCHGDRASTSPMMAALPREPPAARGKALVGADDDDVPRPPCEEQSDGGPSKFCPICLTDVDTEEEVKRLPLCLHLFHRLCIDQWLRGHSTCPICRCNAVPTD